MPELNPDDVVRRWYNKWTNDHGQELDVVELKNGKYAWVHAGTCRSNDGAKFISDFYSTNEIHNVIGGLADVEFVKEDEPAEEEKEELSPVEKLDNSWALLKSGACYWCDKRPPCKHFELPF